MKTMTTTEIREEIAWLKDDNKVCAGIVKDPCASPVEKAEARARMRENFHDLTCLETTLLLCEADPLF